MPSAPRQRFLSDSWAHLMMRLGCHRQPCQGRANPAIHAHNRAGKREGQRGDLPCPDHDIHVSRHHQKRPRAFYRSALTREGQKKRGKQINARPMSVYSFFFVIVVGPSGIIATTPSAGVATRWHTLPESCARKARESGLAGVDEKYPWKGHLPHPAGMHRG